MEDVPLRPSELKMLKRIEAVDPSFRYGMRVKRYFRTHPTTKNRINPIFAVLENHFLR